MLLPVVIIPVTELLATQNGHRGVKFNLPAELYRKKLGAKVAGALAEAMEQGDATGDGVGDSNGAAKDKLGVEGESASHNSSGAAGAATADNKPVELVLGSAAVAAGTAYEGGGPLSPSKAAAALKQHNASWVSRITSGRSKAPDIEVRGRHWLWRTSKTSCHGRSSCSATVLQVAVNLEELLPRSTYDLTVMPGFSIGCWLRVRDIFVSHCQVGGDKTGIHALTCMSSPYLTAVLLVRTACCRRQRSTWMSLRRSYPRCGEGERSEPGELYQLPFTVEVMLSLLSWLHQPWFKPALAPSLIGVGQHGQGGCDDEAGGPHALPEHPGRLAGLVSNSVSMDGRPVWVPRSSQWHEELGLLWCQALLLRLLVAECRITHASVCSCNGRARRLAMRYSAVSAVASASGSRQRSRCVC
jgi:hypothetical protein